MGNIEILLLSIGLAMDSFAIAICKGLCMKKMEWNKAIIIGLYFGIFQALMPIIGYFFGTKFESYVVAIDHWIAFILLTYIGLQMIKETFSESDEINNEDISFTTMILLSIATSIDALAVGITFAFFKVNIIKAVYFIGITAFLLSSLGVKIGNKFGNKYEKKAKFFGGVILIFIGTRILLQHLGII